MSRSLDFTFYGEGKREYQFLRPLLERTAKKLLPNIDVQAISLDWVRVSGLSQVEKMRLAAEKAYGSELLVFHLDSDHPTFERSVEERFRPGYEKLQIEAEKFPNHYNLNIVPVIPIRMTDAWLLADFNAFRLSIGTDYSAKDLNFPERPQQIEAISDPKAVFEQAVRTCSRRRRKTIWPDEIWLTLAQKIDLALLEQVPAYRAFSERFAAILRQLNYL